MMKLSSSLATIFSREAHKYNRTKWAKLAALLQLLLLFQITQILLKRILPPLLLALTPQNAFVVLMTATMAVVYMGWCLCMAVVYRLRLPFLEQYRNHPEVKWPWQSNPNWKAQCLRSLGLGFIVIFVVTPFNLKVGTLINFDVELNMEKSPGAAVVGAQVGAMLLVGDLFYSLGHWVLHNSPLYRFHKIHHEYKTNVIYSTLHIHFVDFLIANSTSGAISLEVGRQIGQLHVFTLVLWMAMITWFICSIHSGYNFPWALLPLLPLWVEDDYHEFHHSHCGNYSSSFVIFDSLLASNRDYYRQLGQPQKGTD